MCLAPRYLTGLLLLLVGLLTAAVTHAQVQAQGPRLSAEQVQQVQALRQEGLQIQQKISQLQQQAAQGNPSLLQQGKELQNMVNATLKAQGFDVKQSIDRLQTLKEEFGKEGATDEQKKKLQQEAIGIQQKLQQAQATAMADPKVKQATAKMEKELIAEMTKLDPTVPEMLKKIASLDKQMRQAMMGANGKK